MTRAWLCFADGTRFDGVAVGARGNTVGEAVFTTGLTGYQEVLTDPSYAGQLVTMTAPQIGNTGCNVDDAESTDDRPKVAGFIVRDASVVASNWRSTETFASYLERHGIVAIAGVDTRQVTRYIRERGAQNATIGTGNADDLVDLARSAPSMEGLDLTRLVTPKSRYEWTEGSGAWLPLRGVPGGPAEHLPPERHVVVIDLGIKRNILRNLVDFGCRVTAVPATTAAEDILALAPDGIFVSNGPGDPAAVTETIATLRALLGQRPTFGICLGHQLLALAAGARTFKLKFGHRGTNQPVRDLTTGRVEITTQNHGFCVDLESLGGRARSTHVHLNDGTSEGLSLDDADAFSVQYHPEAAAGPHDSLYLFRRFIERIDARRGVT